MMDIQHIKVLNGETYHWCKYHEYWVFQKPEDTGENCCHKSQEMEQCQG